MIDEISRGWGYGVRMAKASPPSSAASPPKGLPTLYDVAADAGVSPMSVSRVLNDAPNVSSDMRRRVMRSVTRLGYRRNENARSLRRQRSGLVGLIVTNIDNPYYAQIVLGIEDALDRTGHRILVGVSHGDLAREEKLVREFVARQVDGLVVVPCGGDESFLNPDRIGAIPVVLASREQPLVQADSVAIDDLAGSLNGVSALIARGHRRIAFMGSSPTVSTAQRRYEGYAQALAKAGLPIRPSLVDRTCRDIATSREAARRLVASDRPPTAIFCANNQVTVGALEVLVPQHRADPSQRRIELLGMDNFEMAGLIDHPLTLIDHDPRSLGRSAAQLLQQRLEPDAAATPHVRMLLPTTLLDPRP